jgi:integrase
LKYIYIIQINDTKDVVVFFDEELYKDYLLEQISKIDNIKHKTIISLAYSVGLRVSEVINLKISDIDSKRMIININ